MVDGVMSNQGYKTAHCRSAVARLMGILGLLLVGFLLSVSLCLAQTGAGTVTGTVTDLSQGIVPKADVTLTNVNTGVASKGQSSDVGIYFFGAVPIGEYKIVATKQGFEEWIGTFTLSVSQNVVVNPILKPGSSKTVVSVTGAATPIETQSGAVANIMESSAIRDLPLNGRQVGGLFNIVPGVESGAGGARVNGMKVGALDINFDGATMVDRFGGGIARVQPGIETVQEFNIQTVGSDASYAQPSTVVMASRSGTNQIHGAAYEYIRDNTVLGATRLRTDPTLGFKEPELVRNEFGGYIAGPVYIPHIYNGKDKSFWFFDWEGLRNRQRASAIFQTVPTAAMWQGNLSNAIDPGTNQPITIYDPSTTNPTTFQRTAFPGNVITGPFNQTFNVLKGLTALPTNSNNPYTFAPDFTSTYPVVTTLNNLTAKWDQNISAKDRLSVRYTRSTQNADQDGGYYADPINPLSGMGSNGSNSQTTNIAVNYNRTISPNWLNSFMVGILREPNHQGNLSDFKNWDSVLGTPNPFNATGWPTMYASEVNGTYFGWDSNNGKEQHLTSESIEDNVTWNHGKHIIQFGFRGRKEQNNVEELQQAQGSHSWYAGYTTNWSPDSFGPTPDTGSGFAELALGLPEYLSDQANRGWFYFRQTQIGTYFNDKIKVSPRLTLNLGLRWDYFTPYSESRNRLVLPYQPDQLFGVITPSNIPLSSISGALPSELAAWQSIGMTYSTASSVGYPSALFSQVRHDFGPRVGVAYQLNHNTVIRGSYGIFYVPEPLSLLLQSMRNNPPLNLRYQTQPNLNPNVPGGANGAYFGNYTNISAPASTDYLPSITVNTADGALPNTEGNSATYWDGRNWNDSRDQTWNITVEHELPMHTGLRLSYIGTYGGNLLQQFDVNDAEPKYNYALRTGLTPPGDSNEMRLSTAGTPGVLNWGITGNNHTGYSRDHSFQAEIHHNFANGMAFEAFYTFTRQLNTVDPGGSSSGVSGGSLNNGAGGGDLSHGGGGATVPEYFEILGEPKLSYSQLQRLIYFNSTTIPPHHVGFNAIYDLPVGKGKRFAHNVSTPVDYVIGGWQVATIGIWNSGLWMGVNPGLVQPGNIRIPGSQRAKLNIPGSSDNYVQWFAGITPAGATTTSGTLVAPVVREAGLNCSGNYVGQLAVTLANDTCYNAPFGGFFNPAPRDNIIGPGAWNDDFSLYKHFKIGEKVDLRFSADAFNFFNHPNNSAPNSTTGLQDLSTQDTALNAPRQVQLSLRLQF